jgi:hypothetical protein
MRVMKYSISQIILEILYKNMVQKTVGFGYSRQKKKKR